MALTYYGHPLDVSMAKDQDDSGPRVATLRGAGVDVDGRRVVRIAAALCVATLLVLSGVLFADGVTKNNNVNQLRQHGVPVAVTIDQCIGQVSGSGSNIAGYSCQGTYTVDGVTRSVALPGNTLYRTGETVKGVTATGNPSLFSMPSVLRGQHASGQVFVLPAVLFVLAVLLAGSLLVGRRLTVSPAAASN
jgi:hypothetical protein